MALMGIAVKINKDSLMDLNVKYRSMKISNKAPGTANASRFVAALRFSNVPPKV
ncbi:hypothetical protein D3C81_2143750 [compost metagenome]